MDRAIKSLSCKMRNMGGMIIRVFADEWDNHSCDEIIDVRSPGEFAQDHITNAINLPVLSNDERAEIGTIYKQVSAFNAQIKGASAVSKNIAGMLEEHFQSKSKDYHPLIYCWRGGKRSESLATVLSQIGWSVYLLEGGYRAYRRYVIDTIDNKVDQLDFIILNGLTGSGKTRILQQLKLMGAQILDLEELARHKGSVFGGDPNNPQPIQKRFESLLFDQIIQLDPDRPVYIEAESAKIGRLNLPNSIWQKMKQSPVLELSASLNNRAQMILDDYSEWLCDPPRVFKTIDRLSSFHSRKQLSQWKQLASDEQWLELIESLLGSHYDQRYRPEKMPSTYRKPITTLNLSGHQSEDLKRCANQILELSDIPYSTSCPST